MADATDYLLHAALGVLSGGQKAYQRHLDIQETDELSRKKLLMEEESKKRLLEFEHPLKIEQRQAVPSGYYYDETLNQLLPVPAGGKMEGKFNVPPLKTATSEEKEEAKRAIKAKGEYLQATSGHQPTMDMIAKMKELNNEAYSGRLEELFKGGATKLFDLKTSKEFENTETIKNKMMTEVVGKIKKAFGGQLSEGEREYMNRVQGAAEGMTKTEREIALDNMADIVNNKIVETGDVYKGYGGVIPEFKHFKEGEIGSTAGGNITEAQKAALKRLAELD